MPMNNRLARLFFCLVVLLTLSHGRAGADDEQIWAALKQGGKVILLRHTPVDIREGIEHLAPGNCAEEEPLAINRFGSYPMLRNEIFPRGFRPAFGEGLIILGATNVIGVAVDDDGIFLDLRVVEDCGDLVKLAACLRRQLGGIECKVDGAVE